MKTVYESRKDCNYEMLYRYGKCLLACVGLGVGQNISNKHPWLRALVIGMSAGSLFGNASHYGAVGQIRDTCYPKEEK